MGQEVGAGLRAPTTLLWRSDQALIVTRPESRLPEFQGARAELASAGWPVCIRDCGGSAFPVGPDSTQIALILPWQRALSLERLYGTLAEPIVEALRRLGLRARVAQATGAFCAGSRDIVVGGRKLAGLAQAWRGVPARGGYAMITASVLLDGDVDAMCRLVNRFHRLAGSPLRCRSAAMSTVRRETDLAAPRVGLPGSFETAFTEVMGAWITSWS